MSPDSSLNVTFEWVKSIYTNIEGQVEEKVCTSKTKVTEGGVHIVSIKGEVYPKTYWENSTSSKEIILAGVLRLKQLPKRNLNKFRPWQTHSNFKAKKSHMLEAREISIAFHLQKPFLFLKFIHRSKEINFMKKLWKFHISSIHFAKDLHVL